MIGGKVENAYNKGQIKIGNELAGKAENNVFSGGVIGWLRTIVNQERTITKTYYKENKDITGIGCETSESIIDNAKEDIEGKTEQITEDFETLEEFLSWLNT